MTLAGVAPLFLGNYDFGIERLVLGLFNGMTYGLLAVGLVMVYKSSRFVNFAHGSIGTFGAAVLAALVLDRGLPYWLAFVIAILVAGGVAALLEIVVVRRLSGRPSLIGMIATLGISQLISVFALVLNSSTGLAYPVPPYLPSFKLGTLTVGPPHIAMLIMGTALFIGLWYFLYRNKVGMGIRAAADDPDAAQLEGIPAKRMASLAWAVAGAIAAFSAILVTPTASGVSIEGMGPELLLKGLAGAVIARMASIPIAVAASLGVGLIEQILLSNPDTTGLVNVVIGLVIIIALLRQPILGRAGKERVSWRRVIAEPVPAAYREMAFVRWAPRITLLVVVFTSIGVAYVITNDTAAALTSIAGFAIVGLSVSMLTGVSGQLSLGQFAFAGIAAAASVHVVNATGSFVFGVASGVVSAAIASVLIAIPAMRLKGLALALATLAFALASVSWLLRLDIFLGSGISPAKPVWFGYPVEYAVDYYLFALAMLALAFIVSKNIRESGFGRSLQALRDNEDAGRALTIPARLRKFQLYAVAGAIAGLGGVVVGHSQSQLTVNSFPSSASIDVVAIAVIGGLTVTSGPIIGAFVIIGIPALFGLGFVGEAVLAVAWLAIVVMLPDGLGGVVLRARNAFYDMLARRRGIDPVHVRLGPAAPSQSPLQRALNLEGAMDGIADLRADHIDPSSGTPILSIQQITKRFGGVVAADGVDFTVAQGEIVGIIGPNGAGKTTLFEMVAGFTTPDSGHVVFDGLDVTKATPEQRAVAGLVRSFQDAGLFPTMTVRETLMIAQERVAPTRLWWSLLGVKSAEVTKGEAADLLMERMGLSPYANRTIEELSTGTRRVVEIASLLTLNPRVLLLDEPSAGIAQSESDALGELLLGIRRELGTTMVVIEHDLPLLSSICDRMIAMNLGRVIASGTPDEVRNDPAVVRSYLGAESAAIHRSGLHLAPVPDQSDQPTGNFPVSTPR
ncbi:branched-chain amino acid ABC transporter permease/ATP-binding protein [Nocardioides jishulii]|uniref:ATP-binding cassette domain-containing protein n=1 Tax=Nocardioides jishulii TaxID=2575440 RepID=A0A4U2YMC9_9ACTN|nr:branched-chain amino acid ABC transporter permease/ATP-binding protein [Nocardioides jishulii]QCX27609.1 ATP-binding cassette domain-containing protein [Nocardioides jishulii]TKI62416.1 ATP-binding cassette domain-containing protein [Nocardioides jishulii]